MVQSNVYNVILSVSSFEAHPNFDNTLRIIRNGGKKAKGTSHLHKLTGSNKYTAWLKDKEDGIFAIPALYFPKSLMPAKFWKACPTITNGNEQAHRNINRDGINLTLLRGVMHGQDYNERINSSIDVQSTYGIQLRDQRLTHVHRTSRTVSRLGKHPMSSS